MINMLRLLFRLVSTISRWHISLYGAIALATYRLVPCIIAALFRRRHWRHDKHADAFALKIIVMRLAGAEYLMKSRLLWARTLDDYGKASLDAIIWL